MSIAFQKNEILNENRIKVRKAVELEQALKEINFPWDIVQLNAWAIEQDFKWLKKRRKEHVLPATNNAINPSVATSVAFFSESGIMTGLSGGKVYMSLPFTITRMLRKFINSWLFRVITI